MNIGFNPSQATQMIPRLQGGAEKLQTPKKTGATGFGDLLLKKFEGTEASSPSKMSAGGIVGDVIRSVDAKQKIAAETRTAFLAGESGNLHQTMIANQEASVSFTMMIEMRNKVMEAYQELMRIQI